jgi:DNA-binding PadR family transcriptional regulator
MIRYLLLGLLRDGRARHGYALMKEYRARAGRSLSIGNVYRELQRLRAEDLVRASPNPSGADPRRIPYAITDAGRAEFDAWLEAPGRGGGEAAEDDRLLRAFFAVETDRRVAARVLDEWREDLEACAKRLARARAEVVKRADGDLSGRVPTLSLWLGRRLRHLAVDLDFVAELHVAMERLPMLAAESVASQGRGRRVCRGR